MGSKVELLHISGGSERTLCGLQIFTKDGKQKRALDMYTMNQYLSRVTCKKCMKIWNDKMNYRKAMDSRGRTSVNSKLSSYK